MIIKKDADTIRSYLEDSSNISGGRAELVAIPDNIEELSRFIAEAGKKKTPVTVSGGGTGTTGSRVPFGGAVLSMEKFNKVIDVSRRDLTASVETGVLVDTLKDAADKEGLFYTSHPTEKTASVGGTIATNASGARSFKYGPTRKYIRRLKMVLANGRIFEVRRGEKSIAKDDCEVLFPGDLKVRIPVLAYKMPDVKSAAGYFLKNGMDLIDLFIGQEGTLSVITEADLEMVRKPRGILSVFVFFRNAPDAWNFAAEAAGALSIEYFDENCIRLIRDRKDGVPAGATAAIFLEHDTTDEDGEAVLGGLLKLISKYGVSLDDTWVAMNEKDAQGFLDLRHSIPEAMNDIFRKRGYPKISTDMAVPKKRFGEMMDFYVAGLKACGMEYYVFGHIGECHLHVNFIPRSDEEVLRAKDIYMEFAKKAVSLGGTVSAEHGIGKLKHAYLEVMYGRDAVMEMAALKRSMDPNCILGLGNIFPKELLWKK